MVSGDLHRRQTSQASSCFYGASLGSHAVLEPRLAGPGHPARPDLLLRTPRDPQNILLVQKELDRDLSFSVVL